MTEYQADVIIIGGGLGGVAGALSAARMGYRVILTEETDWIGGQLTAQGVPPDEHPWIESTGCTASYRLLRERIRDFYRRNYPLRAEFRDEVHLNPGKGMVSRLCHEPRVALAAIEELLAPYRAAGLLITLLRHRPIAAQTDGDRVQAVTVLDETTGTTHTLTGPYFLDATETGDLLELAGVEHVIGAESQADTGEPHALSGPADPLDQQGITACFAVDYLPGEDHTIPQPADYPFWRAYVPPHWPGPLLSWDDLHPHTGQARHRRLFSTGSVSAAQDYGLWFYRRILYAGHFLDGAFRSDITLINYPQNDYNLGPIVGVAEADRHKHLRGAKQLSLSLLYWMQTEAPREDGGPGYPGLRLRADVMGTSDGLAKAVYVRESRRIMAEFRITEQHVGVDARPGQSTAEQFPDSVGIGSYRIDLHPSTSGRGYLDLSNYPAQIPLGALIPIRLENLLPACKNIGTTHITNGCYRMHPTEWNIGEVSGALAAHCLRHRLVPRQVRNTPARLTDFQWFLHNTLHIDLEWPEYARRTPRLGNEMRWLIPELRKSLFS